MFWFHSRNGIKQEDKRIVYLQFEEYINTCQTIL